MISEAEEKKASAKRKRIRTGMLALLLVGFAVLAWSASRWDAGTGISGVNVRGAAFISPSEITDLVGSYVDGKTKKQIDLERLRREVCSHPYVLYSSAEFDAHGKININITETKPYAILISPSGRIAFCDRRGRVLPYRVFGEMPDMPVLRNIYKVRDVDRSALKKSIDILKKIEKKSPEMLCAVSELIYDRKQCSFTVVGAENGTRILLGSNRNIDKKIDKLDHFISDQSSFVPDIEYADLRWKDQIVIR